MDNSFGFLDAERKENIKLKKRIAELEQELAGCYEAQAACVEGNLKLQQENERLRDALWDVRS